jgi:hypothetical protein
MTSTRTSNGGKFFLWILIVSNVLVFQLSGLYYNHKRHAASLLPTFETEDDAPPPSHRQYHSQSNIHPYLDIPLGDAIALPSIRVVEKEEEQRNDPKRQNYYGGKGDKKHLGGFATGNTLDMNGISPGAWKYMVEQHGIKSLLDVGCGRGISAEWFHLHGVDTQCVEGSHDATTQSILPQELITEHDFSRGYVVRLRIIFV